jgi:hypothetical protein
VTATLLTVFVTAMLLTVIVAVDKRDPIPLQSSPINFTSMRIPDTPLSERAEAARLKPLRAAEAPPTGKPTTVPGVRSRAGAGNAEGVGFVGRLLVESRPPGARVFVDRRPMGETPLVVPRLGAGSHVIRLDRKGFERWSAAVQVVAGETTSVDVRLVKERP